MGTARADTIDDLLMQSVGDVNQAATLFSGVDASLLPTELAGKVGGEVSALHGLAGLVSEIQSQQDALPETLQSGSQLLTADNQVATASSDVLSAVTGYVNAADAGDYTAGATLTGEVTGYFDRLDLVYAEVFQFLPATLSDEFTTAFANFPNVEPSTLPTDLATGATALAAADTTPASLLSDASTNYTDSNQLLTELSGNASSYAPGIATQIQFQDNALEIIANLGAAESAVSSYGNGVLNDFVTPLFSSVDQGWDQVSEAALAADQAAESAVAGGSTSDIANAMLGLLGPEYQALGPSLQSAFIDLGAHFLTGGDFTLDPVSAVDPTTFADLLSSIGL